MELKRMKYLNKNHSKHTDDIKNKEYKEEGKNTKSIVDDGGGDNLSITWYLKQTNKIDMLSREEEDRLARLTRAGDESAKNKLIKANLRFVVSIAKKYQTSGISLLDLINEGNMGLIKAADRFDPDKGFHFISYAVWWIRQAIILAISQKASLIRIPLNRSADLQKIEQVQKMLENKFGRQPSPSEIAEELDMENEEISHLRSVSKDYLSLDTKYGDSEDTTILSMLADQKGEPPDKLLLDEALKDALNAAMDSLTEPERHVIEMRFGLNGYSPMTLQQIGDKFKLSKERIRQIEKKAIRRMRHPSCSHALKVFLQD
jgi:RNA polymerase primary sigma factor